MNDKPFKTYDELLQILISRGVDISTPTLKSNAKKRIQHEGFYNLINGYKTLFLLPKQNAGDEDQYKPGTTVDEIYALYNFDRRLRNLFFRNILIIETNIKSLIAYYFSQAHNEEYFLKYNNFDTTKSGSAKNISNLLSDIQKQISGSSNDPSISHYLKNYGYIPLWVLNNILTFGLISKFYSMMKQQERQDVARVLQIQEDELESALFYLSKVRNFCAHGNRLYCFRSKNPFCNTPVHASLSLPMDSSGNYLQGRNDLFATVIILKRMLSKNVFKIFIKNLNHELDLLRSHLNVLTEQEVLDVMGFPTNWKNDILKS